MAKVKVFAQTSRRNMKLFGSIAVVAVGALLASSPSKAATVYSYTGNPYTTALGSYYSTNMSVSGSFTVAGPLQANLGFSDISAQILSYSFSDGFFSVTQNNPGIYQFVGPAFFDVATDAAGNITTWSIGFSSSDISGDLQSITTKNLSSLAADMGQVQYLTYNSQYEIFVQTSSEGFNSDTAGTWSVSGDLLATPLPGTLPLMAGGLGALGLLSRRRKRKRELQSSQA